MAAAVSTVISAAVRAAAAVLAGLALAAGFALVLWAMTPAAEASASSALGGAVVALASAHFLPVAIAGVPVTIHPLLLTGVAVGIIATAAGRARAVRGRVLEAVHGGVFVVVYGVAVDGVVGWSGASDVSVLSGLAPAAIAAIGTGAALAFHPSAWQRWWFTAVTPWLRVGVRAGLTAAAGMLTVGALVLTGALIYSFPDVIGVADMTVDSVGAGLGMALLCAALLPNAVIAAAGYATGAGFTVGAASFSPLVAHPVALPEIPLLAATPTAADTGQAVAALLGPVLVALLVARVVSRGIDSRVGRLLSCAVAAATAGLVMCGLAAAAGGGVLGGPWATSGAPPLLAGALVAGVTLLIAAAVSVGVMGRSTQRRASSRRRRPAPTAAPQSPDGTPGAEASSNAAPSSSGSNDEPLG